MISLFWTSSRRSTHYLNELPKSKLFSYGIGEKTIKWINSFLCYRKQQVVVNGETLEWAPVLSKVPQWTVLGPLLFSLYIIIISTDIDSEFTLFADGSMTGMLEKYDVSLSRKEGERVDLYSCTNR